MPSNHHKLRLKSAALNNRAVSCMLNLTDSNSKYERLLLTRQAAGLLRQSLKKAPNNQIALLN